MTVDNWTSTNSATSDDRMSLRRLSVIIVAVVIMMLDGFDVFVAAYTVPRIAREWGLTPDQAGFLLSCGLVGMAMGTLLLSSLGDIFGRRRVIVFWLVVVGTAMSASALASNVWALSGLRVLAGLGIGSLSSILAVLAAETAPARQRDLVIGLVSGSFPAGAIIGGIVTVPVLDNYGWRAVYLLGGGCAALILPAALMFIPRSSRKPRRGGDSAPIAEATNSPARTEVATVERNRSPAESNNVWASLVTMLTPPSRNNVIILVACYIGCLAPGYFINSWAPKLASDFGLSDNAAISVSLMQSVGSVLGGLFMGLLIIGIGRHRLTLIALGVFSLFLCLYPVVGEQAGVNTLRTYALIMGFAMFCAGTGLFAMIMDVCPAGARATGLGLATGVARVASSGAPLVGGVLLAVGLTPFIVCTIVALPMPVAALILHLRKRRRLSPA